jgi:hypothetical protein
MSLLLFSNTKAATKTPSFALFGPLYCFRFCFSSTSKTGVQGKK